MQQTRHAPRSASWSWPRCPARLRSHGLLPSPRRHQRPGKIRTLSWRWTRPSRAVQSVWVGVNTKYCRWVCLWRMVKSRTNNKQTRTERQERRKDKQRQTDRQNERTYNYTHTHTHTHTHTPEGWQVWILQSCSISPFWSGMSHARTSCGPCGSPTVQIESGEYVLNMPKKRNMR